MSKSVNKLRAARKTNQKAVNTDEVFKSNFERPSIENIILNDELRSFIPALKQEELVLLEQSIREEGVRDALLVWKDEEDGHVLIDGYNRQQIIRKLQGEGVNVKYSIKTMEFPSLDAVKDWMITNQLGRRNLTAEQRSYLRGLRYQREKEHHGGGRKASDQNDHLKTSARLASEYKVGEATIRRDSEFALGLEKVGISNPELKRDILDGRARISKSIVQKLSKYTALPDTPFEAVEDIVTFVTPKSKKENAREAPDKFTVSKEKTVAALKRLNKNSKNKDIGQIRLMLDQLEKMLKG